MSLRPAGATATLHLVAPLLEPYERKGFCTIYVDYESHARPKRYVRNTLKITFDTSLQRSSVPPDARVCAHVDEDPLNDCKPVYCDTHYNGRKPYYSTLKKRCLEVPACLTSGNSDIPRSAYNPVSNRCVNKPAISNDDINFIKSLTAGKGRPTKDILIISAMNRNSSQSPSNGMRYYQTSVTVTGSTRTAAGAAAITHAPPAPSGPPASLSGVPRYTCFMKYVACNKRILLALSGVIFVQCCLICTMMYCFARSCSCCRKKKIVDKFFNYRQDATVTTPLICTSNIDTETTDYQYLSESSNYIDKKIRCYKACQRERKTAAKFSMSDDILAKCVTRRDWRRLPRSETIPEVRHDESLVTAVVPVAPIVSPKPVESPPVPPPAPATRASDSSEREIRVHSYHYEDRTLGVFAQKAGSIERGAQACFSNDSIDDFLSERGVLFIGDNASRYSFSSLSSAASPRSSDTSKQHGGRGLVPGRPGGVGGRPRAPASDPGRTQSQAALDLQLLHLSRASMASSSNDSEICRELTRVKDSTSSL